jgi:hypothetical protein
LPSFDCSKIEWIDLGNPVLPPAPYYTQRPPQGNSHFRVKRLEKRLPGRRICRHPDAVLRQVESAMQTRPVDHITRRALPVLPAETAWLCGFRAASLQRFALVVTRQASEPTCNFEQMEPIVFARHPFSSANARTIQHAIPDEATRCLMVR